MTRQRMSVNAERRYLRGAEMSTGSRGLFPALRVRVAFLALLDDDLLRFRLL